jgi:hypothetical protein
MHVFTYFCILQIHYHKSQCEKWHVLSPWSGICLGYGIMQCWFTPHYTHIVVEYIQRGRLHTSVSGRTPITNHIPPRTPQTTPEHPRDPSEHPRDPLELPRAPQGPLITPPESFRAPLGPLRTPHIQPWAHRNSLGTPQNTPESPTEHPRCPPDTPQGPPRTPQGSP